ncbi:ras guanine nucleotide exchange factor domain-containing protein [Hygrophoropsis aurantiaca]|uniref:Ras guanine nucleotide exchange factor domain-containing protein n=1 Tax=Hygrophoropsis aurantiaca TaxID=72124 RepID=A0ACB8AQW3_9AGAM|nr:ras guanine nucleotide exchange factor domain-containing protein [Hygrophoropsis aurantiaca]
MNDGRGSIAGSDLDSDPWQQFSRLSEGGRRGSLKGKEHARPPGTLKLPPRGHPPVVAANSTNSSPFPREESRRLHSTTSMQSIPVANSHLTGIIAGRVRSGSLGMQPSRAGRNVLVDTAPSVFSKSEIAIAVVGTPGCGKTTFVSEDARAQILTGGNAVFAAPAAPGSVRYTRRIDWVTQREAPCFPLTIYEMDISGLTSPPPVDGILVCYDASDKSSFAPVEGFLRLVRPLKLPVIGVACKSDLEMAVNPQISSNILSKYDVGLVTVSNTPDSERAKMRKAVNWLLRCILVPNTDYRNPASPDALSSPVPWEARRSPEFPTASVPVSGSIIPKDLPVSRVYSPTPTIPSTPPLPNSPTRTRSMSDLLSEPGISQSQDSQSSRKLSNARSSASLGISCSLSSSSLHTSGPTTGESFLGFEDGQEEPHNRKEKQIRSVQHATLEELLDKLLFLAVSGDDSTFLSHFLLTYRRFASPRSILLAMQKRMRQLDSSSGDPMFACYAQMRICHLLETWIHTYPHDFAVPGASGALNALVKSIISKTYLLHYGSDFLPFLEHVPGLVDKDAAWALKCENTIDDIDDPYYPFGEGEYDEPLVANDSSSMSLSSQSPSIENSVVAPTISRERKSSLPLSAKAIINPITSPHGQADILEISPKHLLKELQRIHSELQSVDCTDVAEEITRVEAKLFMQIEPRHWLQFTLAPGPKDAESDSISRFNAFSEHLASWVASLILCHEKPKHRAKQMEKLVDIAHKLRALNNYSALRAFVAGINSATFQGDETMEMFMSRTPDHHKNFLSWEVLLQHRGAHHAYRMALKNTTGACIPALEIHMSDLIRAQEGNKDFSPDDPSRIHWGKFNLFGKFIQSTTQCQMQCQTTADYDFPERSKVRSLVFNEFVMSEEMKKSRIAPLPDSESNDEPYRPSMPRPLSRDDSSYPSSRDAAFIRKWFR